MSPIADKEEEEICCGRVCRKRLCSGEVCRLFGSISKVDFIYCGNICRYSCCGGLFCRFYPQFIVYKVEKAYKQRTKLSTTCW